MGLDRLGRMGIDRDPGIVVIKITGYKRNSPVYAGLFLLYVS